MILVTAISHHDVDTASRLYKWIQFLSEERSLRRATVLFVANQVANRRARMSELLNTAFDTFGEVYMFAPEGLNETGWPRSCNAMFREALNHVESYWNDDLFWLEPDAVPLVPEWFEVIESEFEMVRLAGKSFLGAYVPRHIPHMSGIGVYGRNWRQVAPKLAAAHSEAWDVFAAEQVVPNAHFTDLIQHQLERPSANISWSISEDAVVYHQNKNGALIKRLDQERYGGELYGNADDIIAELQPMPKYFHARNARRLIAGLEFAIYAQRAGTVFGVFEAVSDSDIAALEAEVCNPRSAVTVITAEEYQQAIKKKPRSINGVQTLNRPIVPVNPMQGLAQALAAENMPSTSPDKVAAPTPVFESKEQFLRTGTLPQIRSGRARTNQPTKTE